MISKLVKAVQRPGVEACLRVVISLIVGAEFNVLSLLRGKSGHMS